MSWGFHEQHLQNISPLGFGFEAVRELQQGVGKGEAQVPSQVGRGG